MIYLYKSAGIFYELRYITEDFNRGINIYTMRELSSKQDFRFTEDYIERKFVALRDINLQRLLRYYT